MADEKDFFLGKKRFFLFEGVLIRSQRADLFIFEGIKYSPSLSKNVFLFSQFFGSLEVPRDNLVL